MYYEQECINFIYCLSPFSPITLYLFVLLRHSTNLEKEVFALAVNNDTYTLVFFFFVLRLAMFTHPTEIDLYVVDKGNSP